MNQNIKELFTRIYNQEPNDEQLGIFTEYLQERLSYNEKKYLLNKYDIDLFTDECIERHIQKAMQHPVIIEKLFTDGQKDEVSEIFEKCKDKDYISISYIQRTFNKSFPFAAKIFNEMIERGYIEASSSNRGNRINKR